MYHPARQARVIRSWSAERGQLLTNSAPFLIIYLMIPESFRAKIQVTGFIMRISGGDLVTRHRRTCQRIRANLSVLY